MTANRSPGRRRGRTSRSTVLGGRPAGGDRHRPGLTGTGEVMYRNATQQAGALAGSALLLAVCAHLSLIVLPWAAWRAGLVGLWAPVVATVVVLVHFVLPVNLAFEYGTFAALGAVFGYLGVRVLRTTDAEGDGADARRPRAGARLSA